MKTANFLALSGGGARGRLELDMLQYLYEKMGGKFFRHFDTISGTSTGSLITALLAVGNTPKQITDIYDKELKNIFNKKFCRELVGKSKYSNEYMKGLATNLIGNKRLGDLVQQVAIPTVNSSKQETKIFKSYDEKDKDYFLVDVIIASSAAPRYFPAHVLLGLSICKTSLPTTNNILSIFKPLVLSSIPLTPFKTLLTAIWLS